MLAEYKNTYSTVAFVIFSKFCPYSAGMMTGEKGDGEGEARTALRISNKTISPKEIRISIEFTKRKIR